MKVEGYEDIIGLKKKINYEKKENKLKRFEAQEKEILIFKNLKENMEVFPFESYKTVLKSYMDKNVRNFISTIIWDDENQGTVLIKGDNTKSKFILSKTLKSKYYDLISQNRAFGKLKVIKHNENEFFIEGFEPLRVSREENYKRVSELRKEFTLDEWENVLLGSIGYDLSDSEYLTKHLLLVRLIPYVEKNYNYIELGGMATGKTTMAEMFNTSEKINVNISSANLIYNGVKKEYGMLFNKDVLYLDETNFSKMDKEVAPALLQAKSGNKIEVRGRYDSKVSDVSFISQGNILNPVNKFVNKTLLEDFKKGFNAPAHFDRECFFLAGWLIPSYTRISLNKDTMGLRLDVLEDYLSVLRGKSSYHSLIKDLKVELKGSLSTTRFESQILKTISGFLKILNPNKKENLDTKDLEKIVALSVYGKYLLQESASDLGESNFESDYVTYCFKGINKYKVSRQSIKRFYLENKENKYFQNPIDGIEELEDSPFGISGERESLTSNINIKIDKVDIPNFLLNLLTELGINSKGSKVLTHYRYTLAYKYSNKTEEDKETYLLHMKELSRFICYAYKYFEINYLSKIIFLDSLLNEVIESYETNYESIKTNRNFESLNLEEKLINELKEYQKNSKKAIQRKEKVKLLYDNTTNLNDLNNYEKKVEELKNDKFRMEVIGTGYPIFNFTEIREKSSHDFSKIKIKLKNIPIGTKCLILKIEKIGNPENLKEVKDEIYYFRENMFRENLINIKSGKKIAINSPTLIKNYSVENKIEEIKNKIEETESQNNYNSFILENLKNELKQEKKARRNRVNNSFFKLTLYSCFDDLKKIEFKLENELNDGRLIILEEFLKRSSLYSCVEIFKHSFSTEITMEEVYKEKFEY